MYVLWRCRLSVHLWSCLRLMSLSLLPFLSYISSHWLLPVAATLEKNSTFNNNYYKEWASEAHSYTMSCIKLYINDCAVLTVESDGSTQIYRLRCGTARPTQTLARTCTSWQIMWLAQSATQETCYLCCSFAHKSSQEKTPRIELPPSVKHPYTTLTPKSNYFAVTKLPHISLPFDLILFGCSREALSLASS